MTKIRLSRVFWIGAAAILIVAALVGLVAVVRGDFSDTDGRILGTLAVLLYTGGAFLSGFALIERKRAPWLGWTLVAGSVATAVLVLRAVWEFDFEGGDDDLWQAAWSSVLCLLAGMVATTSLLLAKRESIVRLAWAAGGLAGLAAFLSVAAIWEESPGDGFVKTLAATWILAALAYFLVPVLERFSASAVETGERVLGTLGDVELVATRSRNGELDVRLAPGERLLLRRRA